MLTRWRLSASGLRQSRKLYGPSSRPPIAHDMIVLKRINKKGIDQKISVGRIMENTSSLFNVPFFERVTNAASNIAIRGNVTTSSFVNITPERAITKAAHNAHFLRSSRYRRKNNADRR